MFIQSGELVIISRVKIKRFFKSLKTRLFLVIFLIGLLPAVFLLNGLVGIYEKYAVKQKIIEARTSCDIVANQISSSGYLKDSGMESVNTAIGQLANYYDGRIMVVSDNFKIIKDTFSLSDGKTIISESVFRCLEGENVAEYDGEDHFIEIATPIKKTGSRDTAGVLFLCVSTESIRGTTQMLKEQTEVFSIALAAIGIVVSATGSIFMLHPFRRISTDLEHMAEGYSNEGLSVNTYTETEDISVAFNRLWARMKVLDDSRQDFVSNVSHELKTPITSMKVLADSLLMQEDVSLELYKEFMADIAAEIDRESKIIDDLLSLVKMDKSAADLNIASCDINGLVETILKRLRPIAAKRNVDLVFESFRPVTAEVDEVKFSLAISNLVENAIKYNVENGWVHVTLNADHKYFFVKVEDSGLGIPEEDQEHIFERFYRVDKSHSREIGGTGLGLAITRSAVIMHRGAIKVYSREKEGTTFTVRIPLNYIV